MLEPRQLLPFGLAVALMAVVSCRNDSGTGPTNDGDGTGTDDPPGGSDLPDPQSPEALLVAWEDALRARDAAAYLSLLVPPSGARGSSEYHFKPLAVDRIQLPWCEGTTWGYDEEARLIGNLFDSELELPEGSAARPVRSVIADVTESSRVEISDTERVSTVDLTVRLVHAAGDTTRADARLVSELGKTGDGTWQIESIHEIGRSGGSGFRTWASVITPYWIPDMGPGPVDPAAAVATVIAAWEYRDLAALEGVLAADFEFFPRVNDVAAFEWLESDSWDRDLELLMAENMFDPTYSIGEARPVAVLDFRTTPRTSQTLPNGHVEVVLDAEIYCWFNATDAFHTNGVLTFEVGEVEADLWTVHSIRERDPAGFAPWSVEDESWASIKALYRFPNEL